MGSHRTLQAHVLLMLALDTLPNNYYTLLKSIVTEYHKIPQQSDISDYQSDNQYNSEK